MWSFVFPQKRKRPAAGKDSRRQQRFSVHDLRSPLGELVDLSSTGMRVHADTKPKVRAGDALAMWVRAGAQQVAIHGRVMRVRRIRWREWDIGVRFLNISQGQVSAILALAQFGYVPTGEHRTAGAGASAPPQATVEFGLPNHYRTLGLKPDAPDKLVHHTYRELARTCHPDLNKSPEATARFIEITQAYYVLRDAEARAKYDSAVRRAADRVSTRRSA